MRRLQKIALATALLDGQSMLPSKSVGLIWDQIDEDPKCTIASIAQILDPASAYLAVDRLQSLDALAERLEYWSGEGITPILADEPNYPARWVQSLREKAPKAIFVWGDRELLDLDHIGVAGSRNLTEASAEFAEELGEQVAKLGLGIASGAARGADSAASRACLQAGSYTLGLPIQLAVSTRELDPGSKICLASPFAPNAPFTVGNAMARNKLVYSISQITIVVQSDIGAGGTWSGATEAISKQYGRVAAWSRGGAGCEAILERGAEPISDAGDLVKILANPHKISLFD